MSAVIMDAVRGRCWRVVCRRWQ